MDFDPVPALLFRDFGFKSRWQASDAFRN